MKRPVQLESAKALVWGFFPHEAPSMLKELPIFLAAFSIFYAFLAMARYWLTPLSSQAEISLSPGALPMYAMFSVTRIAISYFISLIFAVVYGYVAAYNPRAERVMIPLLDTLQSIPVLSFLPGVMLAMVALFPRRQLGIELGSILLIFSGQAWNMAFSFYSSLKSIPSEMHEVAEIYRWSPWQKLVQMELPFSTIGLVWNSMISVASAWFYLIACEMFVLGDRDFRLPGLGSYLQTAANAANMRAIVWGLVVMVGVIVAMDQLIWRPVIAWAEKFKFEQVESAAGSALTRSRSFEKLARFAAGGTPVHRSGTRTPQFAARQVVGPSPRGSSGESRFPLDRLPADRGNLGCHHLRRCEDDWSGDFGDRFRTPRCPCRRRRHFP